MLEAPGPESCPPPLARPKERFAGALPSRHGRPVEPEALIYRDEVVAMLFGVSDLNVKLAKIIRILEQEFGGEEELEEDDT